MSLRILPFALAAAGAIALSGVALAQSVPERFVVSGKAAEKIHDFTTINLATAERIAEVCEKAVATRGGQHSIMVLDRDGNLDCPGARTEVRASTLKRAPRPHRSTVRALQGAAVGFSPRSMKFLKMF